MIMRRLRAFFCCLYALLFLPSLSGCAPADPDSAQESIQVIAMDTAMLITTYGEHSVTAAYAAEDVIRELEAELSRTMEDSDVSRLNAAAGEPAAVEGDLLNLLGEAGRYYEATGGAFDITIAPVASAWGFTTDNFQVPDQAELETLLELVDGAAITISQAGNHGEVRLAPGQSVDLGAIAKGYAADRVAEVFREYEVPRGLAQLGGNVLAWGNRPDETPWRVGIQDPKRPDAPNGFAGILTLENAFAVTSGGYQRYFEQDGKSYHHIIDPATGCPADSGLTSVTVIAGCTATEADSCPGAMCDAFSTALFIMGEEKALEFRRGWSGTPFELVLVTEDGRVVVTSGLTEHFTLDEESGYVLETVS